MTPGKHLVHLGNPRNEVSFVTDLEQCRLIWNDLIKPKNISDLWEFRNCFQRHYNAKPCFLVRKDRRGIAGMLPLSNLEEEGIFVFFPGETWKGKTWMERTPIFLRDGERLDDLLRACPQETHLRYMERPSPTLNPGLVVDEIGYVLYPGTFDFDVAHYAKRFSAKKFKNLKKTVQSLTAEQSSFHINRLEDFDVLVDMSLQRFEEGSYLFDSRFRESFRDVMVFLKRKGWLHMVSLEIKGQTAAIDLGAMFNDTYTVFLGGTHPEFPGIAKAMNMYHVEFACMNKFRKIDFLCGDFHWKKLWHLDPEPLYHYVSPKWVTEAAIERPLGQAAWHSYGVSAVHA